MGEEMSASASTLPDGAVERRRKKATHHMNNLPESSSSSSDATTTSTREALYGALVRALVVLFARPVRLFRPVKVSSLQLLESLAKREGRTLSFRYLWRVLRRERWSFLPHLLGPPLLYQTVVGFSLFSVYTVTESRLTSKRERLRNEEKEQLQQQQGSSVDGTQLSKPAHAVFTPLDITIAAGAAAGVAQCILSAPLDNVRFILENGLSRKAGGHHHHPVISSASPSTHRDLTRRRRAAGHRFRLGAGAGTGAPTTSQLQVSWRAVAKAALLPFLPAQAHSRIVDQVKEQGKTVVETAAKALASGPEAAKEAAAKRKLLWQQTLTAWRGGLHGSGLIMSLCRDSVGFAAFFTVFELSRRCAYHSSIAIDRFEAWINTMVPLLRFGQPTSTPSDNLVHADLGRRRRAGDDFYIESSSPSSNARSNFFGDSDIQPDISYNSTRTVPGRVIAALVLVVGGAIGATLYELVGRPFELMRIVIFTGTRDWEKEVDKRRRAAAAREQARSSNGAKSEESARGRSAQIRPRFDISAGKIHTSPASHGPSTRAASPDRALHGRTAICGARTRALNQTALLEGAGPGAGTSGVGLFLTLRSSNTMGSTLSRVSSSALRARRRPAHPLALLPSQAVARRDRDAKVAQSVERRDAKLARWAGARAGSVSASASSSSSSPEQRAAAPKLPARPSALSLLIAHAQATDPAFKREMTQRFPAPIAYLALCGKAYFVGPFVANAGGPDTYLGALKADERAARARKAAIEQAKARVEAVHGASASASEAPRVARPQSVVWQLRHRGSHAWDGALRWTSVAWESRWGWALRKMATPYGLGFLAFAWFGGDLNR
ncbi:hypothetical protein OC842_004544 [Tilletia horrida]|uniref:Mitochondrial carrier protein n=1 Tax=Tilletia horrida TaxID=155126 RepID=A0AAN6JJF8_9BASI|nr:hypothetical protein OC842_004544 [Tilletia horrida]